MAVGEPLQLYEVGMLFLLVLGFIPITIQFLRYRCRWFYSAYCFFIAAVVFTNAEAFAAPVVLNYLEHGTLLVASFLFWMTAYRSAESVIEATPQEVLAEVLPGVRHQ